MLLLVALFVRNSEEYLTPIAMYVAMYIAAISIRNKRLQHQQQQQQQQQQQGLENKLSYRRNSARLLSSRPSRSFKVTAISANSRSITLEYR